MTRMSNNRLQNGKWQRVRKQTICRDVGTCVYCGWTPADVETKQLQVHHIIPARLFDDKEAAHELWNLVTLCSMCHGARESATRRILKGTSPLDKEHGKKVREDFNRIVQDLAVLREHHPEIFEMLRERVCEQEEEHEC